MYSIKNQISFAQKWAYQITILVNIAYPICFAMKEFCFKSMKGRYTFEKLLLVIIHIKYNMVLIIHWQ